jgi:hypothetical protein
MRCAHCGCRTLADYQFGEKKFTDRLYCRTCFRFTPIGKPRRQNVA